MSSFLFRSVSLALPRHTRLLLPSITTTTRAMSSDPALHTFFVYAPDKLEEGTFEKRLAVREQHLTVARQNISEKVIRFGGALMTPESLQSEQKKLIGSTMVFSAPNIDVVRKLIESDIYYTTGVWDPERIVITPMLALTPFPN
jgi:uncharacterized protein YciI